MSIIQQAIDNKPLIQQIVTNLLAGKSSEDIFESTGYASDVNLPADRLSNLTSIGIYTRRLA